MEATAAEDAGGDRLLFAGPAFTVSAGPITLALRRVEMTVGDEVGLFPGAGETLVLVEQGEVELEIGEAAPRASLQTVVGSDTAYAVRCREKLAHSRERTRSWFSCRGGAAPWHEHSG